MISKNSKERKKGKKLGEEDEVVAIMSKVAK